MKRSIIVLVALAVAIIPASALDPTLVEADLSTFLSGVGNDLLSSMQQSALLGQGIGDASIGDFPHWYLTLSTGAVLSGGIAKVVDQTPTPFKVLNMSGILDSATSSLGGTINSLFKGSRSFFPYPNVRLAFGFGLAGGFEVSGQVSFWPEAFTDALSGTAGLSALTLDQLNAGIRVRKVLLREDGPFPSISVGVGYLFSSFNLGYDLKDAGKFDVSAMNVDLTQSKFSIQTSLHTAGVDITLSKKLSIFVPYVGVSSWYQWGSYTGEFENFKATLGNTVTISPKATVTLSDLSFLISGGVGFKLGGFVINLGATYNPKTNTPAAELGMGVQF